MNTAQSAHDRIDALLHQHPVVLFMKGTRQAPQCGFSAATIGVLNELLPDYHTVNVLADEEIRQGIKEYGNWPTIPQLYVKRELIGGADIVQSMHGAGQLHELFGLPAPDRTPPTITITDAAADAIRNGMGDAADAALHLHIDARFQPRFSLEPASGSEIAAHASGIVVLFDLASAARAKNIVIDWVETVQGSGLSINNPNAPQPVHKLSVTALKNRLDKNAITVIDVRPPQDRALAPFAAAQVLDESSESRLLALDKDTPLAFLCHHGNSSRNAAEYFREQGFRHVFNVEGGVDAWSNEIDPSLPRY